MIAEVIVDVLNSNVDRIYDYAIPEDTTITVGYRVLVNFAGRNIGGIVVRIKTESSVVSLKPILKAIDDDRTLSDEMIALMWHMKEQNHMLLADVLRLFMPSEMRQNLVKEKVCKLISISPNAKDISLLKSKKQVEAFEYVLECGGQILRSELVKNCSVSSVDGLVNKGYFVSSNQSVKRVPYSSINSPDDKVCLTMAQQGVVDDVLSLNSKKFLLYGVTGSGKTEVYMHLISAITAENKTAIMLVPEIALTPQMLKLFRARFGDKVAILHSGLSAGERYDEWWRLKNGEALIAIGARSAIFAPIENVGIIIIDEEHEQTYIPDSSKFTTYDVANFRSEYSGAKLLLGSATPSVATYYKAKQGELKLLKLTERINMRALPDLQIVDMRREVKSGNNSFFSAALRENLAQCLSNGSQAMLFLNRRGYSPIVICSECGYVAKCDDCDVSLTYHKEDDVLKCHYCDKRFKMLDMCPVCKSETIRQKGVGTERVVFELNKLFPNVRVLRMDNDTTSQKEGHAKIVRAFSEHEADILVGTQMIAKGHDFSDVALVGILDADQSLFFSDYRSVERTFQLITQVAGRAGRADIEGSVILQTYIPKHYIFELAAKYNYEKFFEREIALREGTHYPPFAKIVRIVFSSENEENCIENLKSVYGNLLELQKDNPDDFIYLNKMKSPIKRIQNKFRYQILMRLKPLSANHIIDTLYEIVEKCKSRNITSYVEVEPNSMS